MPGSSQRPVISADAQMLNPRKVHARVELAVEVCVYAEETAEVCIQADHGDDGSIQTLEETYKDLVAVDVAEKNFTFSDVASAVGLSFSNGTVAAEQGRVELRRSEGHREKAGGKGRVRPFCSIS